MAQQKIDLLSHHGEALRFRGKLATFLEASAHLAGLSDHWIRNCADQLASTDSVARDPFQGVG